MKIATATISELNLLCIPVTVILLIMRFTLLHYRTRTRTVIRLPQLIVFFLNFFFTNLVDLVELNIKLI